MVLIGLAPMLLRGLARAWTATPDAARLPSRYIDSHSASDAAATFATKVAI